MSTIITIVTKFDKLFQKLYQKFVIFLQFIHKMNISFNMIHTFILRLHILRWQKSI